MSRLRVASPSSFSAAEQRRPALAERRGFRWLALLALFLTVVGARLALVQHYTNPLPFWDQWDGEAGLLKPWLEGQLSAAMLFAPHNEHRIVLTRLLTLALFVGNGQWDAQLEMAANALLCGAIAIGMAAALRQLYSSQDEGPRALVSLWVVALFFVLPFGWENTLMGFQSQFYFLLFFSLAAIWGLGIHPPGSRAWWLGVAALVLACLSMASGFLAAAPVLGLEIMRWLRKQAWPSVGAVSTGLICVAVLGLGWKTKIEVPHHVILKAESVRALLIALGRCLAWPFSPSPESRYTWPIYILLVQAPILTLGFGYLRWLVSPDEATVASAPRRRVVEFTLAVAGWVWLQAAAIAYTRGGSGGGPASRYMDLLALGAMMNFFALSLLVAGSARPHRAFLHRSILVLWVASLGFGLVKLTRTDFADELPALREHLRNSESNVRAYVATGDLQRFLTDKPEKDTPYPDAAHLARLLDDPVIRRILPTDVRTPLHWESLDVSVPAAFVPGGTAPATPPLPFKQIRGSYSELLDVAQGGEFRARLSTPITLPYLRFEFAGDLGEADLEFSLRDTSSGRQRRYQPARVPREHWRADYLAVPGHGGLEIVAADRSPSRWFAFSEPTEVGRFSYWAGWFLRRGNLLFAAGASGLVLVSVLAALAQKMIAPLGNQKLAPFDPTLG